MTIPYGCTRTTTSFGFRTSSHKLTVFAGLRTILTAPVGVGRSVLPTPNGTYYIVELLKQPDPYGAYGPYAFGLSAFSNVLYNFGGVRVRLAYTVLTIQAV